MFPTKTFLAPTEYSCCGHIKHGKSAQGGEIYTVEVVDYTAVDRSRRRFLGRHTRTMIKSNQRGNLVPGM